MKHTFIHTMNSSCTYNFISSSLKDLPEHRGHELAMRQEPQRAKVSVINERDRRPIEPPPILQIHWLHCSPDDTKKSLQCPFYFMVANLISADSGDLLSTQDYLDGSTMSSLYRLRDVDDTDGGFFVFGNLYCKKEGYYKLQFSLFEIIGGIVQNRQTIMSEPFKTYMAKHYPGPVKASLLSKTFSDQGVKMRIRKEHRSNNYTGRKRKLDVQALMDPPSNHPQPVKIAPAQYQSHHATPPTTPSLSYGTDPPFMDEYPGTPPHSSPIQPHAWGESLPPLKAVMAGYTSRSTPLVLPCPFNYS
ncbi:velvet factor-domain-containing protein [Chlamydoabsidia padenii]|nr:velvet factor-domain-containing protein [Chlamydoabsidia padenii]